jgi:hypothetical protein
MSDIKLPKRYLIQCNTKSFFSLKEWLNKNAGKLNLDWASIIGNPEDNPALIQYIDNKIVEVLAEPQEVKVNEFTEGIINNQFPANIEITDGVGLVTPTSTVVSGNNIIITVPKSSGISFQIPLPQTTLVSVTGDVGWRAVNGFFDYNKNFDVKQAVQLDFASAYPFFRLKENVSFNGESNKLRYVSVRGNQDFSEGGINGDKYFIDKLTGLGYLRGQSVTGTSSAYATMVNAALGTSFVVDGI